MKKETKKTTISSFIKECTKTKGWDLIGSLEKGETLIECSLRQPCYYPTLLEFIGEQSANGKLDLERMQNDISESTIEDLLNVISDSFGE